MTAATMRSDVTPSAMERSEILAAMGKLKLYGMKAAFDEIITTAVKGSAKHRYETIYCGRGQTENFIKLHKAQLASDRTSCCDPRTNRMRLIPHTAAYWLRHTQRAEAPKRSS